MGADSVICGVEGVDVVVGVVVVVSRVMETGIIRGVVLVDVVEGVWQLVSI